MRKYLAPILKKTFLSLLMFSAVSGASAACVDNVVLIHGNTGSPSDWDNTYDELISLGYSSNQIYRPSWGYSNVFFASFNDHSGFEETPVRNAINDSVSSSCTGRIDVIAHSMGATLGAQQIIKTGHANNVETFVGVAAAYRGLHSCGTYPFNYPSSTCGRNGLSISSPFLNGIFGKPLADYVYSIKSYSDEIVCSGGCEVNGVHSSQIEGEDQTFTFDYGHFELQENTYSLQVQAIQD